MGGYPANRTRRSKRGINQTGLILKYKTKHTSTPDRSCECNIHSNGRIDASHAAFTLVELLTVLAIVGILATLLMSSLSIAKKKSRVASSTSNLRQIAIAFTLYHDDHAHRPLTWDTLLSSGYLGNERILKCPEDRQGNWGNLVQPDMTGNVAEWAWDFSTPYSSDNVVDPIGASSGERRALRGGHFDHTRSKYLRVAFRSAGWPGARAHTTGFRLVKTVPRDLP